MLKENSMDISSRLRKFMQVWHYPNRLYALRATISMSILSIPFFIAEKPFIGVTLSLGALAGALSETDDHPKGRIKSLLLTIASFFIASISVGLLYKTPWLLGAGFILSTLLFILLGGISEGYRAITFGSILIGIYAMLGISNSPDWYWQGILLPAGALFHGILSLVFLYQKPFRPLDEKMAQGFEALSKYLEKKALLFPSNKDEQAAITKDLVLLNINVVNCLEKIKEVLNNYDKEVANQELLLPYLQRFMLLQSLHERAASSHDRYEKLSNEADKAEVVEGFGEMLRQLSYATKQLAENILTGASYRHPLALEWISQAIETKLENMEDESAQHLVLLHHNLNRSHISLKYLDNIEQGTSIPRLKKDERSFIQRIRDQVNLKHPRFRYAIRLSISFIIGFTIVQALQLEKGVWVMLTSLFVSQITYTDTRRRLFQRLLGTVTGVVLGIVLMQVFATTAGLVILMLGSAMAFFYWLRTRYSVAVIFITIYVICAFNLISPDEEISILVPRLIYTLLGATLSFLVIRFLWPGWQFNRMPKLISDAMQKNTAYFKAIIHAYTENSSDDLAYRIARREAHIAENELTLAWNSMRLEPKSKRKHIQHAFTLIYLNHALLSYMSALGAHREGSNEISIDNITEMTQQIVSALTSASEFAINKEPFKPRDLSPLLIELKQQITAVDSIIKKQHLRLFYSITGITNKIVKELHNLKAETD